MRSTAMIAVAGILIAAATALMVTLWYHDHPQPLYWDEAAYVNQALDDRDAFTDRGGVAAVKALIFEDPIRPPAYRAIALLVTSWLPPSVFLLRAIAGAVIVCAFGLVAVAGGTCTTPASGLLGTSIAFASPALSLHSTWYGTEFALIGATALLLLAVTRRVQPVVLTAAIGLGLLSKASFLVVGAPVVLVTVVLSWRERREILKVVWGTAAGATIATVWWAWHVRSALEFAQLGRTFPRAAISEPLSRAALGFKLNELVWSSSGIGVSAVVVVLAIAAARNVRTSDTGSRRAFWLGAAAFVPLPTLAMLSPVFVGRHYAPAFLGLALILAVGIDSSRLRIRIAVAAAVLAQTLFLSATHETSMRRVEQTEWTRLRNVITSPSPRIAFMGGWPSLSPPEIRFAWRIAGEDAAVRWLWRFEDGVIDWDKVMTSARKSDVVLVVPPGARHHPSRHLGVDENADNRHNAEFVLRLTRSGLFETPTQFTIGRDEIVSLLVFRRLTEDERLAIGEASAR